MDDIIKAQRKDYRAAYAWGLKVQKACLLKPVEVSVKSGYCEANDMGEGDMTPYTVEVTVWDAPNRTHVTATWATFLFDFKEGKARIEAFLAGKGIVIK